MLCDGQGCRDLGTKRLDGPKRNGTLRLCDDGGCKELGALARVSVDE